MSLRFVLFASVLGHICLVAAQEPIPVPAGFRELAPGVLTVVPPDISTDDAAVRADIHEIAGGRGAAWDPAHAPSHATLVKLAQNRAFPRDVWCLEFAYKAPRLIDIDVPDEDFRMRRERVWYLVYRVRNLGGRRIIFDKDPRTNQDDFTRPLVERFDDKAIRFSPHFVLETHEALSRDEGLLEYQDFLDRLVPTALAPIAARERIPLDALHDSVSIGESELEPGEQRWGVAVWESIDRRFDFFSIFVYGLTNAIRWQRDVELDDQAAQDEVFSARRDLECLRLDFWHPGDEAHDEREEMQVAHAGMFERIALGSRLLEAATRSMVTRAEQTAGLAILNLSWREFLEPEDSRWSGGAGLVPVERLARRLSQIEDPEERRLAVRQLLGDQTIGWFEELAAAVAGPVDPDRDADRRTALEAVGLTPEAFAESPLEAFATILEALEQSASLAERRERAAAFFGAAASRLDLIAHEVALARAKAVLRDIEADEPAMRAAGARAAIEILNPSLASKPDPTEDDPARHVAREPGEREEILRGLFGHEGPEVYRRAMEINEGVDYSWVFRTVTGRDTL
jgi:hypothetical protein